MTERSLSLSLSSQGAEVNTRDNYGWTPLHESCNYGNLELTRLLLDNQACIDDPGGRKCDGVTPLMDAASNGHEDVVRLLVEKGADLAMKDVKVWVLGFRMGDEGYGEGWDEVVGERWVGGRGVG